MSRLRRPTESITPHYAARPVRALTVLVLSAVLIVGLATSVSAGAKAKAPSKLLWATVNVCDTAAHPDGIGIRGSMPGTGSARAQMFMRFQVQYLNAQTKAWQDLPSGDSGFVGVGSAKYRQRQAGRTFTVRAPASGAFTLRGAVTFEWREAGEVLKRKRLSTTAGHPKTPGADPAGFSAATCAVKP